jgi:plasmid stabilization system protein ParE
MSLPLVFRNAAQAEFDEAAAWYESRQEGLGADFVHEIQHVLESIAEQPKRYPIVSADIREAPVRRFPYCIYYRAKADRAVVLAVFHTSRNPAVWQSRA